MNRKQEYVFHFLIAVTFVLFTSCASLKTNDSSLELVHDENVVAASYCQSEGKLATLTNNGILTLWDTTNGQIIRHIDTNFTDRVVSMLYTSLDGIIVQYENNNLNNKVVAYDPLGINEPKTINPYVNLPIGKMIYNPYDRCIVIGSNSLNTHEDTQSNFTSGGTKYTTTIKDIYFTTIRVIGLVSDSVNFDDFISGGETTYTGTADTREKSRQIAADGKMKSLTTVVRITSLAMNSKGIIACGLSNGKIFIYDTKKKRKINEFINSTWTDNGDLAFSPNDRSLLTGSGDGYVRLWNTENWSKITQMRTRVTDSLLYSPNGDSFIASSNIVSNIFDSKNGQMIYSLNRGVVIKSVLYKENRNLLVIGIKNKSVYIWYLDL